MTDVLKRRCSTPATGQQRGVVLVVALLLLLVMTILGVAGTLATGGGINGTGLLGASW
jgi:hypothetical protein